jgi:hypothetical protein
MLQRRLGWHLEGAQPVDAAVETAVENPLLWGITGLNLWVSGGSEQWTSYGENKPCASL